MSDTQLPCPVCGNEVRHERTGLLSCECSAPGKAISLEEMKREQERNRAMFGEPSLPIDIWREVESVLARLCQRPNATTVAHSFFFRLHAAHTDRERIMVLASAMGVYEGVLIDTQAAATKALQNAPVPPVVLEYPDWTPSAELVGTRPQYCRLRETCQCAKGSCGERALGLLREDEGQGNG